MDLYVSLQKTLETLTDVSILLGVNGQLDTAFFENSYCFSPTCQLPFSAAELEKELRFINRLTIYEFCDILGVHYLLFYSDDMPVLIGPYVNTEWEDSTKEPLLLQSGIPNAHFVDYKLYYCRFPILPSDHAFRIATAFLAGAGKNSSDYTYTKISQESLQHLGNVTVRDEKYSDPVELRYQIENEFEHAIEEGDVDAAFAALSKLQHGPMDYEFGSHSERKIITGATILRTLCRGAARRTGISPLMIDSFFQEYAQKLALFERSASTQKIRQMNTDMISGICRLVKNYREEPYTPLVHKVVHYIQCNLSHNLTASSIAEEFHLSAGYLSRQVKDCTGKSLTRLIMHERMKKAAYLLCSTDYQIQVISNYVGYADNNYFVKLFKKEFSIPPTEYRRQYRQ